MQIKPQPELANVSATEGAPSSLSRVGSCATTFFSLHHHRQILRTTNGPATTTTTAKITAIPAYNALSLGRFINPIAQTITSYPTTTKPPVNTHFPYLLISPPLPYINL